MSRYFGLSVLAAFSVRWVALVASFHSTMSFFSAGLVSLVAERLRGGEFWGGCLGDGFSNSKQCCCKRCLFLCYSSSFLEYLPPCLDSVTPLFCVRLKGLDAIEESLHRLVILKFRWFASAMKSLGYFNANVFPIRVTSEGL